MCTSFFLVCKLVKNELILIYSKQRLMLEKGNLIFKCCMPLHKKDDTHIPEQVCLLKIDDVCTSFAV